MHVTYRDDCREINWCLLFGNVAFALSLHFMGRRELSLLFADGISRGSRSRVLNCTLFLYKLVGLAICRVYSMLCTVFPSQNSIKMCY
jgi:hypothetical protein